MHEHNNIPSELSYLIDSSTDDINSYPDVNFFSSYFNYLQYPVNTEASLTAHRWSAISIVSAMLGSQFYLPFGFRTVIPNQYIQLIGEPAAKKTTAITQATQLLKKAGYDEFAPETTSQQQFLIDLHDKTWGKEDHSDPNTNEFSLTGSLFGSDSPKETAALLEVAEMYIASDEFVDFIGINNLAFITLLGKLWDYVGVYDKRLRNKTAVYINSPTISILAGNTPENFNSAFPPSIQGQGFFSRMVLVNIEPTNRKRTIPAPPSIEDTDMMITWLQRIKTTCLGSVKLTPEAYRVIDRSYHTWKSIEDTRFAKYSGRRQQHLLKLTLTCTAARLGTVVHSCDVLLANTLLTYAEQSMPKAMGQFGRGRNSAVIHKILTAIQTAFDNDKYLTMVDLLKLVHQDVDKLSIVHDLINELITTDKIQVVKNESNNQHNFLPVNKTKIFVDGPLIKPSWLWPEERIL